MLIGSIFGLSLFISSCKSQGTSLTYNKSPANFKTLQIKDESHLYLNPPSGIYKPVDKEIFLTNKLVYDHDEEINIFSYSSTIDVYFELVDNNTGSILTKKMLPTDRPREIIYKLNEGLDLSQFNKTTLSPNQPLVSQWYKIVIRSVKTDEAIKSIPVFIESKGQSNDILFVESTDTFRAYNYTGSFWSYYTMPQQFGGVFYRPNAQPAHYWFRNSSQRINFTGVDCRDHLMIADAYMQLSLKDMGFKFDRSSDTYLDKFENISNYNAIIFGSHNEYWTLDKLKNIRKFIDNGGKVLILGGNNVWRWVDRTNDGVYIWGSGILKRKWNSESQVQTLKSMSKLNKLKKAFLNQYLGTYYDSAGYNTYAPYQDVANKKSIFGKKSGLPHCDAQLQSNNPDTLATVGAGASGGETDKIQKGAEDFELIAKGMNPDKSGADLVYKVFPKNNGAVLNFGSIGLWSYLEDPKITKLIKDFLE